MLQVGNCHQSRVGGLKLVMVVKLVPFALIIPSHTVVVITAAFMFMCHSDACVLILHSLLPATGKRLTFFLAVVDVQQVHSISEEMSGKEKKQTL